MTEPTTTPSKPKLILVESDRNDAAYFTAIASRIYEVTVERDAASATTSLLDDSSVAVFVAGASSDRQSALKILERVSAVRNDVLRVMLAGPSDLAVVVAGLHSRLIERAIHKPIDQREVLIALALPPRPKMALPSAPPAHSAARQAG